MEDTPEPLSLWPSAGLLGDPCLFRIGEPRDGDGIPNVATPEQSIG